MLTRTEYATPFCLQAALDVFENQMPELSLQPDIITYNSLLRTLGRSQDATFSTRVMGLYKELCHSTHVAPDKHTISAVFSAAMQLRITDGGFLFQVCSSQLCCCSRKRDTSC